jgi:hypothetical protein
MRTVITARPDSTYVQAFDDHDLAAEVRAADDEVRVQFHVHGGHVEPTARAGLVDAVLDLPEVRRRHSLHATVPVGDSELITQLRSRCLSMSVRAAGSTCLIEAELNAGRRRT